MTCRMFDPNTFGSYNVGDHPKMLHFQYKGSEDVFRYILVERIPIGDISSANRRKKGEGKNERIIVDSYIRKEDDAGTNEEVAGLQRDVCDGTRTKSVGILKRFHKTKHKQEPT